MINRRGGHTAPDSLGDRRLFHATLVDCPSAVP